MTERLIWMDGDMVPPSEAKVGILSPTAQFGANVFEGLRAYKGKDNLYLFRLDDHIGRLQSSIRMARFESRYSYDDFANSINESIKHNNFREDVAVRQIVYLDGEGSWVSNGETKMVVAPILKGRIDPHFSGYSAAVSSWERISSRSLPPMVKMGANYMNSRLAQQEAVRNGYQMAIFLNDRGTVSEGPGACIFMVKDGEVITPPLESSILNSITRDTFLKIATDDLGIKVSQREISRSELYTADELFLVGTSVELVFINSIDGLSIGESMGCVASKLMDRYFKIVRGEDSNYSSWLTPVY